jgi:hypothetical protein
MGSRTRGGGQPSPVGDATRSPVNRRIGGYAPSCASPSRSCSTCYDSPVSELAPPSLSGTIVLRNLDAFRAEVGPQCVARAVATMPESVQTELDALVPTAWMPVESVDALYEAIAAEADREITELYPTVVVLGVTNALQTVWKWLLRLTTDRALVSRTPVIYERGHNVGTLETRIVAPGRAEIILSRWPHVPPLRLLGIACGVRATLEVAGRKDVSVRYDLTPEGATFHARWKP